MATGWNSFRVNVFPETLKILLSMTVSKAKVLPTINIPEIFLLCKARVLNVNTEITCTIFANLTNYDL